jgi:hypothetical protein
MSAYVRASSFTGRCTARSVCTSAVSICTYVLVKQVSCASTSSKASTLSLTEHLDAALLQLCCRSVADSSKASTLSLPAHLDHARHGRPCIASSSSCAAYVSIRQHTSAYVSILQHTSAYAHLDLARHEGLHLFLEFVRRLLRCVHTVLHASAYVSIRQHTPASLPRVRCIRLY